MSTRKSRKPLPEDPTVAEIRAIRAQLWKEAGGNIGKYFENAAREGKRLRGSRPVRRQPRRGKAA